jgi:TM2 domain-containing membrane protein YozV
MERKYVSALLSGLIFPGAGQFYNRERLKGTVYIVLTIGCIIALAFVVMRDLYHALEYAMAGEAGLWEVLSKELSKELSASRTAILVCILILAISWAVSVVDAYLAAQKEEIRQIKRFISRKG